MKTWVGKEMLGKSVPDRENPGQRLRSEEKYDSLQDREHTCNSWVAE